jgi:hypothetical protein
MYWKFIALQAGYYDWRLAEMDKSGEFIPIRLAPKSPSSAGEIAQGRFIVHPAIREEIIHEGICLLVFY